MAEDERSYQRQRKAYTALYPAAKLLMKGLYSIMIVSCIAMVTVVRLMYRSCVAKKKRANEW